MLRSSETPFLLSWEGNKEQTLLKNSDVVIMNECFTVINLLPRWAVLFDTVPFHCDPF